MIFVRSILGLRMIVFVTLVLLFKDDCFVMLMLWSETHATNHHQTTPTLTQKITFLDNQSPSKLGLTTGRVRT